MEALSNTAAYKPAAHDLDDNDNQRLPGSYYRFREEPPKPVKRVAKKASTSKIAGVQGPPRKEEPAPETSRNGLPRLQYTGGVPPRMGPKLLEPPSFGYHGTDAELEPGDHILPSSETGYSRYAEIYRKNPHIEHYKDFAFFTEHMSLADHYAGEAVSASDGKSKERIYRVEPVGQAHPDATLMHTSIDQRGLTTSAWMAPKLRVLSEVQFDPETGEWERE